jgi:hypothetical protein
MTFTFPPGALPCAMLFSAIAIASWLASKKSKIIDAIVFLVALSLTLWILFAVHVL